MISKRSKVKEKQKQYRQRPEVKKRMKEYHQRPEQKEKRKQYYQRRRVKTKSYLKDTEQNRYHMKVFQNF